MAKKKLSVKPVITGVHPQGKKYLALHYHPEDIKKNVAELKEMSPEEPIKFLFEDIEVLVSWALQRLPLVAPPNKEASPKDEAVTKSN